MSLFSVTSLTLTSLHNITNSLRNVTSLLDPSLALLQELVMLPWVGDLLSASLGVSLNINIPVEVCWLVNRKCYK